MPSSSRPPAAPASLEAPPGIGLEALEHPLPSGMRDLLPGEARRQADLATRVMDSFELFGYERVALPVFEYADVLERGLGDLGPQEVLRFVEPETGEVVALRSDVTPQIARLVTTRLADEPPPIRLAYEGAVLRRRNLRARSDRQIPQAGVELVGTGGPLGDVEVLTVASAAVRAAGLGHFVLDLGHAQIVTSLLGGLDRARWPSIVEALGLKDATVLERRAEASGLPRREQDALVALTELHGGSAVWDSARKALSGTAAEGPMKELEALWRAATDADLAPDVTVDLGETWNFNYYTGVMFQILAEGPGARVGSGGRYDGLFERFGSPRPAAGFALDLDNLGWALGGDSGAGVDATKVLVARKEADAGACDGLLRTLRARGIACAPAPPGDRLVYARAWGYSHVLDLASGKGELTALGDESRLTVEGDSDDALAAGVERELSPNRRRRPRE